MNTTKHKHKFEFAGEKYVAKPNGKPALVLIKKCNICGFIK